MILDEQFDADDILRDADERYNEDEEEMVEEETEEMRELNFGTYHDETANFNDMASELGGTDEWE